MIAVGKAAPAMARGALRTWSSRIEQGLIVVPDGTGVAIDDARLYVTMAGHPVPDARSVEAAERALAFAHGEAKDLLLVLVSGGASALLCAPAPGVTLEQKIALTRALLDSGASIRELNLIRRHLSRLKGGGLARAGAPGRVLALVASDVIGGEIYDVGSGPTTPDPTTCADAEAALSRVLPALAGSLSFVESMKADEAPARRQRTRVVAGPADFVEVMAAALGSLGLACRTLPPTTADAETLAQEYRSRCEDLAPGEALVRAAEPRLAVRSASPGRGGRATHLAAAVGRDLPDGFVFLAGASDGVDGSSGLAGAVVDGSFRTLGSRRVDEALDGFDSASLHAEAGTGIDLGPTGQNFADVHVLARARG